MTSLTEVKYCLGRKAFKKMGNLFRGCTLSIQAVSPSSFTCLSGVAVVSICNEFALLPTSDRRAMCTLKPGSPFQIYYLAALNGNPVFAWLVLACGQKISISECPNEIHD